MHLSQQTSGEGERTRWLKRAVCKPIPSGADGSKNKEGIDGHHKLVFPHCQHIQSLPELHGQRSGLVCLSEEFAPPLCGTCDRHCLSSHLEFSAISRSIPYQLFDLHSPSIKMIKAKLSSVV